MPKVVLPRRELRMAKSRRRLAQPQTAVIEVDVQHLYSGDGRCACCPAGRHRYASVMLVVNCVPELRRPYAHEQQVEDAIRGFAVVHGRHGHRVRLTLEDLGAVPMDKP